MLVAITHVNRVTAARRHANVRSIVAVIRLKSGVDERSSVS
jgi:hypothetical protein